MRNVDAVAVEDTNTDAIVVQLPAPALLSIVLLPNTVANTCGAVAGIAPTSVYVSVAVLTRVGFEFTSTLVTVDVPT
jgi:hypothetical protein